MGWLGRGKIGWLGGWLVRQGGKIVLVRQGRGKDRVG